MALCGTRTDENSDLCMHDPRCWAALFRGIGHAALQHPESMKREACRCTSECLRTRSLPLRTQVNFRVLFSWQPTCQEGGRGPTRQATPSCARVAFPSTPERRMSLKRNTPELIRQWEETGHPVVLTTDGTAEVIVPETASSPELIARAGRAGRMEALRGSIEDMRAGRVVPAEDRRAEMRHIRAEEQGR
jgi:hypothetical protein